MSCFSTLLMSLYVFSYQNWKSRQSAYEELKKLVQVENCDAGTYTEYGTILRLLKLI